MIPFANLIQKIKERTDPNEWILTDQQEDRCTFVNKKSGSRNDLVSYSDLSTRIQDQYGLSNMVYRKQVWMDGMLYKETFELIFSLDGTMCQLDITTKRRDKLVPFRVVCNELNEHWKRIYSAPLADLTALKETYRTMIYELPEFRLYAVTGMLKGDGNQ